MCEFICMWNHCTVLVAVWHCVALCSKCACVCENETSNRSYVQYTEFACQSTVYHFGSRELSMFASKLESE